MYSSVAEGGSRAVVSRLRLEGDCSMLTMMLGGILDVATRVETRGGRYIWVRVRIGLGLGVGLGAGAGAGGISSYVYGFTLHFL